MTASDNTALEVEAQAQSLRVRLIPLLDRYGILLVILLICLVLYALQPEVFFTWRNITNIFKQTAVNSLLSIGMFLAILTAGIDLSVGSVLALGMMSLAVARVLFDADCCRATKLITVTLRNAPGAISNAVASAASNNPTR